MSASRLQWVIRGDAKAARRFSFLASPSPLHDNIRNLAPDCAVYTFCSRPEHVLESTGTNPADRVAGGEKKQGWQVAGGVSEDLKC